MANSVKLVRTINGKSSKPKVKLFSSIKSEFGTFETLTNNEMNNSLSVSETRCSFQNVYSNGHEWARTPLVILVIL